MIGALTENGQFTMNDASLQPGGQVPELFYNQVRRNVVEGARGWDGSNRTRIRSMVGRHART